MKTLHQFSYYLKKYLASNCLLGFRLPWRTEDNPLGKTSPLTARDKFLIIGNSYFRFENMGGAHALAPEWINCAVTLMCGMSGLTL